MDTGEDAASGEGIEEGVGIASGDEDSFLSDAVCVIPFDCDTMGGVLAGDPGKGREKSWADLL